MMKHLFPLNAIPLVSLMLTNQFNVHSTVFWVSIYLATWGPIAKLWSWRIHANDSFLGKKSWYSWAIRCIKSTLTTSQTKTLWMHQLQFMMAVWLHPKTICKYFQLFLGCPVRTYCRWAGILLPWDQLWWLFAPLWVLLTQARCFVLSSTGKTECFNQSSWLLKHCASGFIGIGNSQCGFKSNSF